MSDVISGEFTRWTNPLPDRSRDGEAGDNPAPKSVDTVEETDRRQQGRTEHTLDPTGP